MLYYQRKLEMSIENKFTDILIRNIGNETRI